MCYNVLERGAIMNNKDLVNSLEKVQEHIKSKRYNEAINLLDKTISKLIMDEDKASSYVDKLVSELK